MYKRTLTQRNWRQKWVTRGGIDPRTEGHLHFTSTKE
jgi:hypothetical protein